MSKAISKIGRTFDKVAKKTGVRRLYDKVVPSGVRRAVSKTWKKIRKPVIAAAAIYLTAGLATAAIGGTSIAGGFATVNSSIAGVFGGGGAATSSTGIGTGSGSLAGSSGGLLNTGAGTMTTSGGLNAGMQTAGSQLGFGLPTANTMGAGTQMTGMASTNAASGGFFGGIKAGGEAVLGGAGKAWGLLTQNTGSALLASSALQGVGAHQQEKRADRKEQQARDQRSWYGLNGYGDNQDLGIGQIQAPTLMPSTTLDDLIKRRRGGY